ncbi:MAG: ABC transporter permease, partial [Sporichthyaceae bacterium]
QSQITIPLLMLQLGLLALVVLWLVLAAATEQRRPEVALALLRGRGRAGAQRLLLRELLPVVLAGVPAGVVVALVLGWAARSLFLPGSAPFEIRLAPVLATLGAAAVLALLTLLAVRRVTREPVETLLRRVPTRASGWSLGVLETLVVAASGTAVVAFVTGGLGGPIALAAPALLALLVGLLLAHVTVPIAAAAGHRLLRRGRVRLGVGVLDAARTPATRRTVAIVTVATALLIFSADALVVGARNRADAAEQQSGAPQVATVLDADLVTVRSVLASLDPDGSSVTPVVKVSPPGTGAPSTLAVVPDQFRHIGLFPGQDPLRMRWQDIAPPTQDPIEVQGERLTGRVSSGKLQVTGPGGDVAPTVTLNLVDNHNSTLGVPLGTVATGTHARRFGAPLHCHSPCKLSGITVATTPGSSLLGTIALKGLRADGKPVTLGPATQWDSVADATTGKLTVTSTSADQMRIGLNTSGVNTVTVHQAWFPTRVPAIVAGRLPDGSHGNDFTATALSGDTQDARRVGRVPRVPAAQSNTALVNLDVVQRGTSLDPDAQLMLWFAHEDPALLARVTTAMTAKNIRLGDTHTLTDVRRTYDESTAAWSLQLAVVVGIAGLLTGILVLLVIAVTTWRLRSRDFAALRMSGVGRRSVRRIAVAEQLIAIGLALAAGVVCGVIGAHFALPTIPLFATAPQVSTLDLSAAWGAVAVALLGAVLVLMVTGVLIGRAIAGRSTLERVRETL